MSSDDGFGPDVEMIGGAPVQFPPPVYGNFRTSTVSTYMAISLIHPANLLG